MDDSDVPMSVNNWAAFSQRILDKSVPQVAARFIFLLIIASLFCVRIVTAQGYYVVAYGLAIYLLKLAVLFVQPLVDPELEEEDGGPGLPMQNDEFKPFIRKMPEFKVWYNATKAIGIALTMSFIPIFNIPVFWPLLLVYFILLFVLTAKKQILHMWHHKYVPFNVGKKRYNSKTPGVREYEK